jgi:alanine racemase
MLTGWNSNERVQIEEYVAPMIGMIVMDLIDVDTFDSLESRA